MASMTAKDIMSRNVTTVPEDMPVRELADFLTENSISGAPVADRRGKLVGVVSYADIAWSRGGLADPARDKDRPEFALRGRQDKMNSEDMRSLHVEEEDDFLARDIMTPAIYQVDEDAALSEVARAMVRGQVHRLFVRRGEQVVGIVTTMDVLKTLCGELKTGKARA